MPQEVAIIAIIKPAPGKLERVKDLMSSGLQWMKENEPGTLEFSIYEADNGDGVQLSMFERYTSWDAVEKHENSDNYKNFFKHVVEEELLAGPPIVTKSELYDCLRR